MENLMRMMSLTGVDQYNNMKKFLLALVLALPTVLSSCSTPKEKSEAEIITEQISAIDSLLTSNAPVTTNSYKLGEVDNIVIVGRNMIYKDERFNFLVLRAIQHSYSSYGTDEGYGLILPLEVKELCAVVDSMYQCTQKKVTHNQIVSFGTNGGVTISVSNSEHYNGWDWDANVELAYQGKVNVSLTPKQLLRFKNIIWDGYDNTNGYSDFNLLAELETKKLQIEKEYFQKLKSDPQITFTESGLAYKIISKSSGKSPKEKGSVKVAYRGSLIDGTEFDASTSADLPVNGVIKGFKEGLMLMQVGDKFKFYIPSSLGYGNSQVSDVIPPNSTLIYDVELLNVL